jgi:hypothetical protein
VHEYYGTSAYIGLERKFGTRITASAVAEDLRSWRVEGPNFTIAQTLRPAFALSFKANERWAVHTSGAWSQGKGFHEYDNFTNSFLISYTRPLRGNLNDGTGSVPVSYPLRFSIGVEQQTFYSFSGQSKVSIVPVVKLTLF